MMKQPFSSGGLALSLALALFAQPTAGRCAEAAAPISAAVLNFQTSEEKLAGKGAEAAVLLNAQLSAAPELILVERQELEKVLSEQELGRSGTVSAETAAQIGKLTGAKVLVTGRMFTAGGKYMLVAKVMSTETSRVYGETASFGDLSQIDKATEELAQKVQKLITERAETLVAKVENPQERLERLKKVVAGKKLPSVLVSVKEQHLIQTVIDPAVQTEMLKMLGDLGFEIIDPAAPQKDPDIAITGEAFSEMAGRRGNLVTCRSRVEIKVTAKASNKLLAADRQNDLAVDLAENIAGKVALQNAALKLLDRIVPQLVAQ